jgi:hypothetical protein
VADRPIKQITRKQFLRRAGGTAVLLAIGTTAADAGASVASGPAAPVGLTALSLDTRVVLAWKPVSGATYNVYRGATAASVTTKIASAVAGTTFADTSVSNGSTYFYAVRAASGAVESSSSTLAQATPLHRGASSGNAVVLENSYPGTTAWKMQGAAQPPTGLEGFATATSINAGESVDLKVNTADGAPYRIEIYRAGSYGGAQARLVSVLPGLVGVSQPDPQENFTTGLSDCSNWVVTTTLTTTAEWPTGVYLIRLARNDNGADNHVLLVIRRDGDPGDVAYAVSVTTYQAYNNWGGKSLYTWNSSGDATVAGTPRAVKVSFDRPFNQSLDGQTNWFTACDISNVSWLEQQGYDISYLTSLDLHTGASLAGVKVLVSPSHDEYWSAQMRTAATSARNAGSSLVFFGANAVYWKIRFEANPFTGTANRVQVCYKTIESGGADPVSPTTTWRDPVVNQPENALLGQMYIGDNGDAFFPLVVSAAQGQNRIWRHTTLASMQAGTSATIGENLVGWEWDARSSNGAEPAGVVTVAASPVNGELLQDAGHTYNPSGSATSNSTVYQAASGAWVFATGTNQWSRALGLAMDGSGEPNPLLQQATLNLLADAGTRPTTPSSGLVLDQLGPPQVVSTSPSSGATGITSPIVTATFDRTLDAATVNATTYTLSGPSGAVPATVSYDDSTHTASLTPTAALSWGASYTAKLTTGIHNIDGSALASQVTWSFTTVGGPFSLFSATLAPASLHLATSDGRGGAGPFTYELGAKISVATPAQLTAIRFYKDSSETGTHVGHVWSSSGQLLASTTFTGETASGWQQQSLSSPLALQSGQTYVVSVGFNAFFVMTGGGLAAQITSGPLQTVADGANGVFGTAANLFPAGSYNSSNYFVDAVVQ